MEELQLKINELEETLLNHKHLGYDKTKTITAGATVYTGQVDSGGTTGTLPTGWTVAHNSTGDYTVTHNLGQTVFPQVTSYGTLSHIQVIASDSTTFRVTIFNNSASNIDIAWYFMVAI